MALTRKKIYPNKTKESPKRLFKEYQKTHNPHIRDQLVEKYLSLVYILAKRYSNRGEPLRDLVQVASVGLLKAIERYDLKRGVNFTTYATPTITGEIKRYFRDKTWVVKTPRRIQELNLAIRKKADDMREKLGRAPLISEIADEFNVSEVEALEALEIGQAYQPLSLDAQFSSKEGDKSSLLDYIGIEEKKFGQIITKISLEDSFKVLSARERIVIRLRFYDNLSQSELAKRLHLSQMQISRIEHQALEKLKEFMLEGTN